MGAVSYSQTFLCKSEPHPLFFCLAPPSCTKGSHPLHHVNVTISETVEFPIVHCSTHVPRQQKQGVFHASLRPPQRSSTIPQCSKHRSAEGTWNLYATPHFLGRSCQNPWDPNHICITISQVSSNILMKMPG